MGRTDGSRSRAHPAGVASVGVLAVAGAFGASCMPDAWAQGQPATPPGHAVTYRFHVEIIRVPNAAPERPSVQNSVDRAMFVQRAAIRTCFGPGPAAPTAPPQRVTLHWTLAPNGAVSDVTVRESTASPAVGDCIRGAVSAAVFAPHPGGAGQVDYTFLATTEPQS